MIIKNRTLNSSRVKFTRQTPHHGSIAKSTGCVGNISLAIDLLSFHIIFWIAPKTKYIIRQEIMYISSESQRNYDISISLYRKIWHWNNWYAIRSPSKLKHMHEAEQISKANLMSLISTVIVQSLYWWMHSEGHWKEMKRDSWYRWSKCEMNSQSLRTQGLWLLLLVPLKALMSTIATRRKLLLVSNI